jgi:N-carbamoyl-L-amino-acid hydrolase
MEGDSEPALGLGSHIDSVPGGGWLDGALGAAAALGVLRAHSRAGGRPPVTLAFVDFADEEGSCFGRSLFGSSAVSGTLELDSLSSLCDAEGRGISEVLAENGVELAAAGGAAARGGRLGAFLELHIEQGPVLAAEGVPCCAVAGCAGVERKLLRFSGQASHAGTTPMAARRDAALAAATVALAVEEIARGRDGVGTCGVLVLEPGVLTTVAGEAALGVDLRHPDAGTLARMLAEVRAVAAKVTEARGCALAEEAIWRIAPVPFDPELVAAASGACAAAGGRREPLTSGALHDAAEISRIVPTTMVFCSSRRGISHAKEEDTAETDLHAAIEAYGALANSALSNGAGRRAA